MNEEVLINAIRQAHVRISALESMMMIFLGSQSKRDPNVAVMLREMAAGEVPDLVPESPVPPGTSESDRATMAAYNDQQRKFTRQAMSQVANMFAEHVKRQK